MATTKKIPSELLMRIRIGHDAENIVCMFDDLCASMSKDKQITFIQLLLRAAIEHKHTELISLLLTDPRCDLKAYEKSIRGPIFPAIKSGNLQLVKDSLRQSRYCLNLLQHHLIDLRCDDGIDGSNKPFYFMSAIQYACYCNQPEILKLLMAYDRRRYPPLYVEYFNCIYYIFV